ncbi:protein of unknown function DUF1499 [Nitrosococcus halophilus Nc 4]|uniref:DUF1499 domain-containing protein n=1 Tax=Nitrosococcus halophilus (strain Nc4) TaxID=472759 RepID=D5C228_NITHN|nr:DUF1499 domain-containing protein [Nitrosococcus halophilus]ADE16616.1 protein of unknown function DUF1499 [Nitrosococcus halophilus Nc 4]
MMKIKKDTAKSQHSSPHPLDRIALLGITIAILSAFAAALSGFGHRLGWWHFATGFSILRWAALGALGSTVLSLWGAFRARPRRQRRGFWPALLGLTLSLAVLSIPLYWLLTARSVPPIHDITTDTQNPPAFSVLLPLRADAPNPSHYGGPNIAAQQQEAYPEIKPLRLPLNSKAALDEALAVAHSLGWKVIGVESPETEKGNIHIEATDSTFWFGFVDDIVVRITPLDKGSKIDVRSVSRVGRSDVGTNARRIHAFLTALKERAAIK